MTETLLPLFPLQVVLFPGSALPLHIFEERYKVLIRDSLARGSEFGINLMTGTDIAPVGCSATVGAVQRLYDDGRMDVTVEGRRRYRVVQYREGEAPYAIGVIEYLAEPEEEVDGTLAAETIVLYNRLVAIAFKEKIPSLSEDRAERYISFLMAQKAGMELAQRQTLLALPTENERLRMLHGYLDDLIPRLERAEVLQRLVRNDGYLIENDQPPEDE